MPARLRLLLLCLLLLAPLPARASAPPGQVDAERTALAAALAGRPVPTIEADLGPLDAGVRAAERAELLTTLAPVLATDDAPPRPNAGIPAPAARAAAGWSDVVQCRRWCGGQLLRWATPPPARA